MYNLHRDNSFYHVQIFEIFNFSSTPILLFHEFACATDISKENLF